MSRLTLCMLAFAAATTGRDKGAAATVFPALDDEDDLTSMLALKHKVLHRSASGVKSLLTEMTHASDFWPFKRSKISNSDDEYGSKRAEGNEHRGWGGRRRGNYHRRRRYMNDTSAAESVAEGAQVQAAWVLIPGDGNSVPCGCGTCVHSPERHECRVCAADGHEQSPQMCSHNLGYSELRNDGGGWSYVESAQRCALDPGCHAFCHDDHGDTDRSCLLRRLVNDGLRDVDYCPGSVDNNWTCWRKDSSLSSDEGLSNDSNSTNDTIDTDNTSDANDTRDVVAPNDTTYLAGVSDINATIGSNDSNHVNDSNDSTYLNDSNDSDGVDPMNVTGSSINTTNATAIDIGNLSDAYDPGNGSDSNDSDALDDADANESFWARFEAPSARPPAPQVSASSAGPSNTTKGNDPTVADGILDRCFNCEFIDLGAGAFPAAGELRNVSYHVARANQGGQKFQVYRPVINGVLASGLPASFNNTYQLVAETESIPSPQAGITLTHEFTSVVQFRAGDFIGWAHTGQGTFPFTNGTGSVLYTLGIEGLGSEADFSAPLTRVYAYEVEVAYV